MSGINDAGIQTVCLTYPLMAQKQDQIEAAPNTRDRIGDRRVPH
jgi:hypothetical protein